MAAKTNVVCAAVLAIVINVTATAAAGGGKLAAGYVNHTVGDAAGWSFDSTTNKSSTDYSAWAAKQNFSLGDYLIFNTNTNQTVIQTYNETTYRNCSMDDALDSDTFQNAGGNDKFGEPLTIAVPLIVEGTQYYFSDAEDSLQCLHGMAFEIKVRHGMGLPPSLIKPPPPPYVEPPSAAEEGQSPPVTIISSPPSDDGTRNGVRFTLMVLMVSSVVYISL